MNRTVLLFVSTFFIVNLSFAKVQKNVASRSMPAGFFTQNMSMVPLGLISFDGSLQNGVVQLQWATGIENGIAYYAIEKSTDGKNFSSVAKVMPVGNNSSYTYTLTQTDAIDYYRVSLVNSDGDDASSNIVSLIQKNGTRFNIYPNPASDYINVSNAVAGKLYIYSASGVLVQTVSLQAGDNKLDIKSLNTGLYFGVTGTEKFRFIKG